MHTFDVRFFSVDLDDVDRDAGRLLRPRGREVSGKLRKRRRLWRRAYPQPWRIDTRAEALRLATALQRDLDADDATR